MEGEKGYDMTEQSEFAPVTMAPDAEDFVVWRI